MKLSGLLVQCRSKLNKKNMICIASTTSNLEHEDLLEKKGIHKSIGIKIVESRYEKKKNVSWWVRVRLKLSVSFCSDTNIDITLITQFLVKKSLETHGHSTSWRMFVRLLLQLKAVMHKIWRKNTNLHFIRYPDEWKILFDWCWQRRKGCLMWTKYFDRSPRIRFILYLLATYESMNKFTRSTQF